MESKVEEEEEKGEEEKGKGDSGKGMEGGRDIRRENTLSHSDFSLILFSSEKLSISCVLLMG